MSAESLKARIETVVALAKADRAVLDVRHSAKKLAPAPHGGARVERIADALLREGLRQGVAIELSGEERRA